MLKLIRSKNGYAQCVTTSGNGRTDGNRTHPPTMFGKDGGHGMIFIGLDGELYFNPALPNNQPDERPAFFKIEETEESVRIKE
ncbi:MAG: hypothetical protein IJN38_02580 [Clostridia bacterium]|nr:hypothetical protein [Clostridia bacterium]